ncbi:MAG: hypothetical protein KAU95_01895 [Candidatus Aenigmarchaeota archaeon]|nr:hypothetical protein [Candidatus Aenigmarchaeota archaeon]
MKTEAILFRTAGRLDKYVKENPLPTCSMDYEANELVKEFDLLNRKFIKYKKLDEKEIERLKYIENKAYDLYVEKLFD